MGRAGWAEETDMPYWYWSLMFFVIGLVSAIFGFTSIAGASFTVARFLAGVFLILFAIFLVLGLSAAGRLAG